MAVTVRPAWNRLHAHLSLQPTRRALREGKLDVALESLQTLDHAEPGRAEVSYLIGVTSRRLGQFDDAFRYLERAEALGWPLQDVVRQRYMARFQGGDITGTQDYLQQLLIDGANDEVAEEIYETLSRGFLAEFRVNDAVVVLDHWLAWRPDAIPALRWRADLYEQDEDWQPAGELYRKIVELDPDELSARLHLGDALLGNLQIEEARAVYHEARERFPEDLLACLGLAQCARRLGEPAAARKLFLQVAESEMDRIFRAQALSELGQLDLESSDYEQAAKHLEASLALDEVNAQTHHLLGSAYSRIGKTDAATEHLERSQSILDKHRRMGELSREIATDLANLDLRFEMGQLLLDLGHEEKASRWFLTIVHIDPMHVGAREALANYYDSRDEHELAQRHREITLFAKTKPKPP
ncbi:MAG: tetratricopeptide repeat protein [Planctomycetota bacterium]|nr:tetratricopeptide repeat protein [Planctomycetota bacterium]